jgi:hypothetical protein
VKQQLAALTEACAGYFSARDQLRALNDESPELSAVLGHAVSMLENLRKVAKESQLTLDRDDAVEDMAHGPESKPTARDATTEGGNSPETLGPNESETPRSASAVAGSVGGEGGL